MSAQHWLPLTIDQEVQDGGYTITLTTNVPCHLWLYWTNKEPWVHPRRKLDRGLVVPANSYWCFVPLHKIEQDEPGDTLTHTFLWLGWEVCFTRWFRFHGTIGGGDPNDSPSDSPIFHKHYSYVPPQEITIVSHADDGHIGTFFHSNYTTVHNRPSGQRLDDTSNYIEVGQCKSSNRYYLFRGFPFFDTSPLAGCTIKSAKLAVWVYSKYTGTHTWDIVIQSGMPTYPNKPLTLSDYYYGYYSGDGGSTPQGDVIMTGYTYIDLTEEGLSWINKTGWTKFAIRSSHDIASIPPLAWEYCRFRSAEALPQNRPLLIVIYDPP